VIEKIETKSLDKILMTGGAGFIGSHAVWLIIEYGYYVIVFHNLEPQVHRRR
jgi:nucleoside-diphosphate-sugar epimerase